MFLSTKLEVVKMGFEPDFALQPTLSMTDAALIRLITS